jgi:hypothetical protein
VRRVRDIVIGMRYLVLIALVACGGSSARKPARVDNATAAVTEDASTSAVEKPAAPKSFPAPPNEPAPSGTWRVTVEFPRLLGRPAGMVSDGSALYLTGAVLSPDDVRSRRWTVVKLDAAAAIAWSSVAELPRSPAPQRIAFAEGGVFTGGEDDTHEASRLLLVERRDAKSGKQTWQRRFTARDAKCTTTACAGKDSFGGLGVRKGAVLYYATVDRPTEASLGELTIAKGEPTKAKFDARSDMRAHDVVADDTAIYTLDDTLSGVVSLIKYADGKYAWTQKVDSGAHRVVATPSGLVLWGKSIEKRAADTGALAWTSPLAGEHIDVAVDGNAIYATVMLGGKPAPYFALAKLDAATGAVQWVRKTSEYAENRPTAYIAVDKDAVYLFGNDADKWLVEKRRKSDGAIGEVAVTARTVELKKK